MKRNLFRVLALMFAVGAIALWSGPRPTCPPVGPCPPQITR